MSSRVVVDLVWRRMAVPWLMLLRSSDVCEIIAFPSLFSLLKFSGNKRVRQQKLGEQSNLPLLVAHLLFRFTRDGYGQGFPAQTGSHR